MSSKQIRTILRVAHLVDGVLIAIFIYSLTLRAYAGLIQFVVVTFIISSGIAMWQLPRYSGGVLANVSQQLNSRSSHVIAGTLS